MKFYNYILLIVILIFGACSHQDDGLSVEQKGTLVLAFNAPSQIGVEQTRAGVGDGNESDGGGFEDLTLVLVDTNNKVVAKSSYVFNDGVWSSDYNTIDDYDKNKSITISFSDLDVAAYTVYAYANVANCMSYFGDVQALLNMVTVGAEFGLAEATFPSLGGTSSTTTPLVDNAYPMLLTAREVVNIEIGTTEAVVELLRPLVEFEFKVVNHCANYPLMVNGLSFKNFNPQTSYISPRDEIYAEHPYNNAYRSLQSLSTPIEIEKNSEQIVYHTYIYENATSSDRYQFNVELALLGAEIENTKIEYVGNEVVIDDIVVGNKYALKNTNTNVYLIDNNGTLGTTPTLNNDNFLNAEFRFSNSYSGYILSVNNNYRYYYGLSNSSGGSNWTFGNRGNGIYRIYRYNYYLQTDNNGNLQLANNDRNREWQLYQIKTKASTPLVANNQQISYVQSNGSATPLKKMLRNQKISVTLNVYFEEASGTFRFYVEEWNENHKNNTSFD